MISYTSRYTLLFSLLFLVVSAIVSIYFYKNTGLSRFKKYSLISLKSASIFLILTLFLEPAILAFLKFHPEETNVVLVDNSRSVSSYKTGSTEEGQINEILSEYFMTDDKYKVYTFSNSNIIPGQVRKGDSIAFNGFETNLSSAFEQIRKIIPDERLNSVIIISDGVFTAGGNPLYPAKTLNCPVTTIGVGDTIQKKDAVIDNVLYNETAFIESITKITVRTNAFLLRDKSLTVDLIREGAVISSKEIEVKDNFQTDEINFEVKESNPVIVKYRVYIREIPDEITFKNNHYDFLINFIDNKINLLFISGGPGYDNSLISGILRRTSGFTTTVRTAKNGNEFYEGAIDYRSFTELSLIFILGYPTSQTGNEKAFELFAQIKSHNVPVVFFASRNTDYKKLELMDEIIPFTIARPMNESLFNPQIISTGDNPFNETAPELNNSPQIFKNQSVLQKTGSEVLMIDKTSGEPVYITRKTASANSTAFLGYGVWRWRLNFQKGNEKTAEHFVQKSVGLTLQKERKTKFKLYAEKYVFDHTESITLIAEVYDENFQPVLNAGLKAKIFSGNKLITDKAEFSISDSKYSSTIPKLPPGDYTVEAEAELNNIFYAKTETRFLVDTLINEFKLTKSNFDNLMKLSDNTGGSFLGPSAEIGKISELLTAIHEKNRALNSEYKTYRFNLWENKYILILIIALLAMEWFIRKRSNIP